VNIVVSANNNQEVIVFPIVPPDLAVAQASANEEFNTINAGTLNLIGDIGLRTLTITSSFLLHDFPWKKKGSSMYGWSYVEFFKKWRSKKLPIRIVITTKNNKQWLNMACLVENFTYGPNKAENLINYTLELKEYVFVKVV